MSHKQSFEQLSNSLSHSENARLALLRERDELREVVRMAFVRMGIHGNTPPTELPDRVKRLNDEKSRTKESLAVYRLYLSAAFRDEEAKRFSISDFSLRSLGVSPIDLLDAATTARKELGWETKKSGE